MATIELSSDLRDKLADVESRVRRLRALRGAGLLVLTLAVLAGVALLADYLFTLPPWARGLMLFGWAAAGSAVAVAAVVIPLTRPVDPAALAAVIEERYPELGERLTSSVELAAAPDLYHGSPALIALLMQETEARTRPLDFLGSVSSHRARQVATAGGIALILAVLPGIVWPTEYNQLLARFLVPWQVPATVVPYSVAVKPGDVIVKQGDPLVIAARVVAQKDGAALPDASTLVMTDEETGQVQRLPMLVDGDGAFSRKIERVGRGFRYHVEAGNAESNAHKVVSVVPVELAAKSPTLTPTAPEYARKAGHEDETVSGLSDLTALAHSSVRFDFRFTRPAEKATLYFTVPPAKPGEKPGLEAVALPLAQDRLSATVTRRLAADTDYRLVLEAEHQIKTE